MAIESGTSVTFGAKHYLSIFTIFSLTVFSGLSALDMDLAQTVTGDLRDWVIEYFGWLFIATATVALLLTIAFIFHPAANRVLGMPGDKPEFSRWSWFSMLFSAGLASGLLYWGTAEPITHFEGNPFLGGTESARQAATTAITVTVFHWGLHGWGLYVLASLAISLSAYPRGLPLTFSAGFIPLLGENRIRGWQGGLIDILALYGTVFGVATSIGLAVGSMNATVEPLIGITFSTSNQVAIVLLVCTLGIFSVLSGIGNGIRRLSELNVWLSLGLLLTLVAIGPTLYLLKSLPTNLWDYVEHVIPMGIWTASKPANQAWQGAWTVFYWGWWLAWTPFVALFVARISRGRTVREFILGVLFVPSLVIVLWMSVFGGTAIYQEMMAAGAVSEAVTNDYSMGLVATITNAASPTITTLLLAVVAFLLFTWLITSLDSATLVICHILHVDHLNSMKILWGLILGGVTCTLLLIGGVSALQAASIIVGLPMAVLVLMLAVSATRALVFTKVAAEPVRKVANEVSP